MLDALTEMARVLKQDGLAIIIIGRESRVRGQRFENGTLLYGLGVGGAGFGLVRRHERVFINRFGERIVEDLLVFAKDTGFPKRGYELARALSVALLEKARENAPCEVARDIRGALANVERVAPSPIYDGPPHPVSMDTR
jgi:hypothetical protein